MKPFNFLQNNKFTYYTGVLWNNKVYSIDVYCDYNENYLRDVEMVLSIYEKTKKTPRVIHMIQTDLELILNGRVVITETDIM